MAISSTKKTPTTLRNGWHELPESAAILLLAGEAAGSETPNVKTNAKASAQAKRKGKKKSVKQAGAAANLTAWELFQASQGGSNVTATATPKAKEYIIKVRNFIPLAEFIASYNSPAVQVSTAFMTIMDRTIALRQKPCNLVSRSAIEGAAVFQ